MPSVRALARELQLNYNTVAGAYRDLAGSGRLVVLRGAGTRVGKRPERAPAVADLAARTALAARRQGLDPAAVGELLLAGALPPRNPEVALVVSRADLASELSTAFTVLTGGDPPIQPRTFDLPAFDPGQDWDLIVTDAETIRLAQQGAAQLAGRAAPALAQSPAYRHHYLELAAGAD